jgi:ribosomal protein L18E
LPDVCFATKHAIKEIEKVVKIDGAFPDLKELAKQMAGPEELGVPVKSTLTEKTIVGAWYSSSVKAENDHINLILSESEARGQPTQYDLNPVIHVRFARPRKEQVEIPQNNDADFDYDKFNALTKEQKVEQVPKSIVDEAGDIDRAIELCATRKTTKQSRTVDLSKVYSESSKYGFSIEVVPDLKYIVNDKLISLTQD